ncbi:MAG TPA: DEAD/DEAH box helicase [Chthoniobacterales bacterium]|jgi:ATP-dependent RNA helicase RhlE|nr:DEAD/DEAH box helicase [Chthoniobacterales bacterium]
MSFQEMGLMDAVVHGVQSLGFIEPTPVQERCIPLILQGRDVIGSAQTGTGKTAAFALPILSKLKERRGPRCLVLEPTRELAIQVETAFQYYARFTEIEIGVVYGGVGYDRQKKLIQFGVDVVVATPGRLLDLLQQGLFRLDQIEILVLDEVDRMLDMGFLPDVKKIVQLCPIDRQTLLFSATIPPEIESLSSWVLRDPEIVEIGVRRAVAETVTHAFYPVAVAQKFDLLVSLLEQTHYESVIVFTRTKQAADEISDRLKALRHSVTVLHSDRKQSERTAALAGFKSGKYEVLVATDIAARGLDIAGVTHVMNYDIPLHPEDYVHRIGRTGRAEQAGDAFTLVTAEELKAMLDIEAYINRKVPRLKLEGFDYVYTALFEEGKGGKGGTGRPKPVKGFRTSRGYSFGRYGK